MNLTTHPSNVKATRAGHSIGRWEKDVLVVDTMKFLPGVLNAPVLNPTKIIAAASNYGAHKAEMAERRDFTGHAAWLSEFDTFLKAPSSIIGPDDTVYLPPVGEREIHHDQRTLAFAAH
jgi:2-keto-4-pentenoate hydratase/2-oxohepta-3-ene-1,7-dioic acid hydratase in catechol pathway